MIRDICKDELFLARKSELATPEDLPVAHDLLETLIAHQDGCVGMAANMIGAAKRIIAVEGEDVLHAREERLVAGFIQCRGLPPGLRQIDDAVALLFSQRHLAEVADHRVRAGLGHIHSGGYVDTSGSPAVAAELRENQQISDCGRSQRLLLIRHI